MSWDAVLIAGPTASGKSALAMQLAERFDGAVINADSMQVYTELRVLTARPDAQDESRAPHLLYGHVPVVERYSAGRYHTEAVDAYARARAEKRLPIFVGGTGLYFRTLTHGLSPMPTVSASVTDAMRANLAAMGAEAFYAAFAARDPEMAARLHPGDTQRLLRAASVLEASGRSLAAWQRGEGVAVLNGLHVACFVLSPPRDALYRQIDARFAAMISQGALAEAERLSALEPTLPAARALGVRDLLAYARGDCTLEAAIAAGQTQSRQYAKRQLTWMRRFMKDWKWLEEPDLRNIISLMEENSA